MTSEHQAGPMDRFTTRSCLPTDHPAILRAIQTWWADSRDETAARELSRLVPRLFCEHFGDTSLVIEGEDGELAGFLVGFFSQRVTDEAYIHFVGVAPWARGSGLAKQAYEWFFQTATANGRHTVRAITSPGNHGSIAFHQRMGFTIEPSEHTVEGSPTALDYDGPGEHRVRFVRDLTATPSATLR
ncbi:GNAT family N-acetyltransferase [Tamaricihabitans halophyticus]|nr:GNAT family N-acetyltransferase [Tamaricihabitans halophyticus]